MACMRCCAALALAWLLVGCGGGSVPAPVPASSRRTVVTDSDRLFRDDRTTMDSLRLAISDAATLGLWWQRATAEAPEPKPAVPTIDFTREMVLLVSAGRRNLGDRIRVDSVGFEVRPEPGGRSSEGWFAVVRTTPDCSPFPGSAYPLEFVKIARVPGTIEFVERVAACPEREARLETRAPPLLPVVRRAEKGEWPVSPPSRAFLDKAGRGA